MHTQAGYREGITAGRGSTLQAGFDEGYSATGAPLGRELGYLRGLASSLLVFLTSPSSAVSSSSLTTASIEETTSTAREIVRRLGKLKVQDVAPKDLEAEAHAREHGEEVEVPAELAEKREMQGLEHQLQAMGSGITNEQQEWPSGQQEVQQCRAQLQTLLGQFGLQQLLP